MRAVQSLQSQPPGPSLAYSAVASRQSDIEGIFVPGSARLQTFIDAAAVVGLGPDDAIRLGVERGLVVIDLARLGRGLDGSRRLLRAAAQEARAKVALAPAVAAWVRHLSMSKAVRAADVAEGIAVQLPDQLLSRASDGLDARSLRADVVEEMVAWEIAAALSGRTMGEWALSVAANR